MNGTGAFDDDSRNSTGTAPTGGARSPTGDDCGNPIGGSQPHVPHAVVIGGGFCGLSAAYELGLAGVRATVLERDAEIGGLAGSFDAGGARLEKFYHHWFTSDAHAMGLIEELGHSERVLTRATRTGTYYAHDFFKLSTPVDLLRFSPLPLADRFRLGLLVLRARRVRNWRSLEDRTAAEWLRALGGERVYRVVWEPLLQGKFGDLADEVAAVWFWNKLKLRGGSRGKGGEERLAYYRGGFAALADALADAVRAQGGRVLTSTPVVGLQAESRQPAPESSPSEPAEPAGKASGPAERVVGVITPEGALGADAVIATPALPIVADLLSPHAPEEYTRSLRRIRYLANLCVVLELDRSLSDIYWLNVNDPGFPFVGVVEHTNFEPASTYAGRHIVYLSKYLPADDALYEMPEGEVVEFALANLRRMFPDLADDWVLDAHVWRARYAQPVVERGYRQMIPGARTALSNLFLATMAQIYPQDRGTNYAIGQGRQTARACAATLTANAG